MAQEGDSVDIAAIRQRIPATQRVTYLNTGFSGPSAQSVVDRIIEYLQFETANGPTTRFVLDRRNETREQARAALASLVGADADEIVLTQNTTDGINLAINGLPWREGDEIVTDDLEHSSGLVPAYVMRQRHGVGVTIVNLSAHDSPGVILEKFEAAMTPRTRALVVSHICYTTGLMLPMQELHDLAHRKGAVVVVDGAQTAGQIPLDLHAMGADYYAFPCHKWVLGPSGVGGFYVRRDLLHGLQPTAVGGHAAAVHDTTGHFEPADDDIRKFELTTTNAGLLAGATAAVEFLQEQGMEAIFARSLALGERLRQRLDAEGIEVLSPHGGPLATGLVTMSVGDRDPRAFATAMWEQHNIVNRSVAYPPGIRMSLAFFNSDEEIDKAAAAVTALLRG